jgi:hypothetical protein
MQCVGTSATMATSDLWSVQQDEVASVATTLFGGTPVQPSHVIGETLRRATEEWDWSDPAAVRALADRVERAPATDVTVTYGDFVRDPLSSWIESILGVEERDGRLSRVRPRQVGGSPQDGRPPPAAVALAELTGIDRTRCEMAIRDQLLRGYRAADPETQFPAFAFRLHQFVARGDTVHATIESELDRYVSLRKQRFVPGDRSKELFPLAFCRECGQDYYVVYRVTGDDGSYLEPRDLGATRAEETNGVKRVPGFVYASSAVPWPDDEDARNARVPEDWLDERGRLRSDRKGWLPQPVGVHPDGSLDPAAERVWWIDTPFRLCLACGVAYAGRLGRDFSRLGTLGSEGRSSATTVLSLSSVRSLRADTSVSPSARKL